MLLKLESNLMKISKILKITLETKLVSEDNEKNYLLQFGSDFPAMVTNFRELFVTMAGDLQPKYRTVSFVMNSEI